MARLADVKQAFEERLSTMPSLPEVAWQNVGYEPTLGTPYIQPFLLESTGDAYTFNMEQRTRGIFQINIYVEADKGGSEYLTIADNIYSHFSFQDLSRNGTCIRVTNIDLEREGRIDSWMVVPISIYYESYSS